ncbi:MAG: Holliday junction branch migration DNA helicase RuvB [Planctomyces sp.]|nr:Holliday junction branch migration DNA helicase RuvB [Planctomyces sp.]MBA4039914.1 Holliday junction branch migration DNA helicase RuvB [Planctomyces sp.]MBA4119426.1 Holliday junction branch migration DNA helicase RuvB [Isosphaera sp.]
MATERIVSPQATPTDEPVNWSLRPTSIEQYVGQGDLLNRLRIAIEAARHRRDPLEHVLLHGPPGLGKTTLAHVIAAAMGTRVVVTSGPALSKGTDLVAALTRLDHADLLFIDEIHRTPAAVEEFVYPAMEDFRIDVPVDSGLHARTVQIPLKPFTLIGATTRAGLVTAPMRSRFGITHHLSFYTPDELLLILRRSAALLGMAGDSPAALDDALREIARRSRGTPRIANRLLRRVRDFAQVRARGRASLAVTRDALSLEGIDDLGLDPLDHRYLRVIAEVYSGGPVGLETVAATLSEDPATLEDLVEPFLLQLGHLMRTRRGRMITRAAAEHLGLPAPSIAEPQADAGLF